MMGADSLVSGSSSSSERGTRRNPVRLRKMEEHDTTTMNPLTAPTALDKATWEVSEADGAANMSGLWIRGFDIFTRNISYLMVTVGKHPVGKGAVEL